MFLTYREPVPKWIPLQEMVSIIIDINSNAMVVYVDNTYRYISYAQHLYEQEIGRELMPHEFVTHVDGNQDNFKLDNLRLYVLHPDWPEVKDKPILAFSFPIKRAHSYLSTTSGRKQTDIHYQNGKCKGTFYSRYVMEQHLGRSLLPSEEVDHIDEEKTNDSIHNLQVLSRQKNLEKAAKARGYRTGDELYGHYSCTHCSEQIYRFARLVPDPKHVFCDRLCSGKWSQNQRYPDGAPRIILNCSYCQNEFSKKKARYEWQLKHGITEFFCSGSCQSKNTTRRQYANHVSVKTYTCAACGKLFERNIAAANVRGLPEDQLTCSLRCSAIARHARRKAKQQ